MPTATIFRVRPGGSRTGDPQLPQRGGQRQPERQEQDRARRNDARGPVGGRLTFARRGRVQSKTAEGGGTVPPRVSHGSTPPDASRTVGEVIKWYEARSLQIIPCKRASKLPSIQWRELAGQGQGLGYPETLALFGGKPEVDAATFNYAVLTGSPSNGLVVIDYDVRERGLENPVATLTVETGKGLHYYVRVRGGTGVRNRSFPRTHLDLRGQGGIAIAPPSLHPSGSFYRLASDQPIREVTEDWLQGYLATVLAKYGEINRGSGSAKPRGWFADSFSEACPEGGRDSTLTSLAGYLLNSRLSESDCKAILQLWAEEKCDPPLDESDVDRVVNSLIRRRQLDDVRENPAPRNLADEAARERGPEDDWFADPAEGDPGS